MIDEEVREWLDKADRDLKVTEHELSLLEEEVVKDAVGFHCQQAVEKYLKAFLISHKTKPKRTHDLSHLLEQCANIDQDFENIEIRELSSFAVDIRYPGEFYEPSIEEVKFYYDLTKRIKNLVLTKLGIKEG
jgi:HEPN domain-containing protein